MNTIALHQMLKEGRKKRKWTQEQAGRELGVSQHRISEIESGDNPSMDLLKKAAEKYGLDMAMLLTASAASILGSPTMPELTRDEKNLIAALRAHDDQVAFRLFTRLLSVK